MIGAVPGQTETRRASRYDAVIATLVGLCALCVSAYTAHVQRQQVRAAAWPILDFDSSNGPIQFTLANKGVGPAIIKHVSVKVDDQPVKNWAEVLEKILGPGYHPGEESDMSGRVFSAGESMNVFTPHGEANNPIPFEKSNPLWAKLNTGRSRVTVEICYCSTLDECWTLRAGGSTPSITTESRRCPTPSATSFQQ
ncbi:MAG: hypothetical protein DME93_11470 [Verrucomicrobia bacterium]|nr:MAG: hypothetical protein DME93_11470 [Verrucomicrobiota bacterium]